MKFSPGLNVSNERRLQGASLGSATDCNGSKGDCWQTGGFARGRRRRSWPSRLVAQATAAVICRRGSRVNASADRKAPMPSENAPIKSHA